ncbi:hypothetical protein RCL_jg10110.t1 [Rhizophagus clarus]|uniref:Uncharacterized protein n=1 Tax=Rhizophagus clarus TaxID=94130 RepID=A0A8H3QBH5_9GLOM|nr:hypothetical protein RCL_jg10110.t1 [Rhizophagus clarus]
MSSSNFIVSYLRTHNKKSFQNFLNVCSQDIIRTSPLSCTSIDTLHGHWFSQFLITLKDYNLVMYNSLHPERTIGLKYFKNVKKKPPPPPSERSIYVVNTPPRRRRKKNRINHRIHRSISVSSFNSISSPPHIPNPSSPTQHESPLSSYDPPSRPILHQQSQQQQHHLQSSPNSPSNSSTLSSISSPSHFPPQLIPESVCNKTCPLHCTK